jgi:hypothetical protein
LRTLSANSPSGSWRLAHSGNAAVAAGFQEIGRLCVWLQTQERCLTAHR